MTVTDDISDAFFTDILNVATHLECDALDLLRPLFNESGLSFKAHNPQGNAAGIFQAMPATLKNLGFGGDWQAFIALDADQQLVWLEKYYAPMRGKLVNATAVYMGTFCPAYIGHAGNAGWRICDRAGTAHDSPLTAAKSSLWYAQNHGLDKNHDGIISVGDLTAAILAADVGPRWTEVVDRLNAAAAPPPTAA